MTTPFPKSGSFLQAICDSSRSLRQSENISIYQESVKRLLLSPTFTSSFKRVSAVHGLSLPLNFTSRLDELNCLAILSLLNFGSGYRIPLHAGSGRGAWDSIRALVFSLYITSSSNGEDLLSAKGIQVIEATHVAELMRLNVHVERTHESIPGVSIGELGGPLYEFVSLITATLNKTGERLVQMGYSSLGGFVAEALKESSKAKPDSDENARLEVVLERLVRAIPAFQDMATVNGKHIYCFKKALFLIHAIRIRFGSISPPPFPIPSTARSPVFADNVLPSMLIHLGIIDLSGSPSLSSLFPGAGSDGKLKTLLEAPDPKTVNTALKEGPMLTMDQAYILRAAAIDACQVIVESAHKLDASIMPNDQSLNWIKSISLPELDMWIWGVAKDRVDYKELERFVLRETVHF